MELGDGRASRAPRSPPGLHSARAENGPIEPLGCEIDEAGFGARGSTGQTSVSGVWAAGNATTHAHK